MSKNTSLFLIATIVVVFSFRLQTSFGEPDKADKETGLADKVEILESKIEVMLEIQRKRNDIVKDGLAQVFHALDSILQTSIKSGDHTTFNNAKKAINDRKKTLDNIHVIIEELRNQNIDQAQLEKTIKEFKEKIDKSSDVVE